MTPEVRQIWRRTSDGALFEVQYVGGGTYSWVDLMNTQTGRVHTLSTGGLLKKYEWVDG